MLEFGQFLSINGRKRHLFGVLFTHDSFPGHLVACILEALRDIPEVRVSLL